MGRSRWVSALFKWVFERLVIEGESVAENCEELWALHLIEAEFLWTLRLCVLHCVVTEYRADVQVPTRC